MALPRRTLLIVLGSIVALILLVALAIPLFLNADAFRTRIETALTTSLGRKVTLGKLDLSVLTGNLVAENATIADDPAFETQPFLQATKVKIGIEMIPLILSREIHVTGFAIDAPKITLLRAANGTWNYSTIGRAQQNTVANKESSTLIPNLTVGHVSISNGQLTVGTEPAPGMPASPRRTEVVLVRLHERLHKLRCDQPHVMALLAQLAPPARIAWAVLSSGEEYRPYAAARV